MIYSLSGNVIYKDPTAVVVECGGVGYKCLTTMNTLRVVPAVGEKVMLYTHMLVREDAMELCGFANKEELSCFRLLISISGVGAKVALAVLSEMTPEKIAMSVSSGDSKAFTKASGVGNKLAQRIVLELKDKVKKMFPSVSNEMQYMPASSGAADEGGNISKAIGALAVLGYSPEDVAPFISGIDPSLSVERIISETLKAIGKK